MSFSTILFTEKGRALQSKALAGVTLQFTKLAMGSGSLGGQSQVTLNALIEPKVTLPITSIKRNVNHVVLKGNFSNADVGTGFYWREIGVYAADPDIGEILYCYGNAGTLAEYIPPQTSEIIEKVVGVSAMVGDATNVTAVMDESLMFVTKPELDEVREAADQAYDLASREKTASEIKFVNTISTADIDNVQDAITMMVTETKAGLEFIKTKADNAQNKADQAFTQASNGKEAIKTAITGKDPSVTIPTDATFAQLAQAIGQIETGVNTDDATAAAEYLLDGLTAYVKGLKVTGTMPNCGAVNQSLGVNGSYTIPQGYHNGQGKVSQSIPVAYPDYSDQRATADISVGAHTGDGQNYAYIHVPNDHFLSNVNWMRSHQPDLLSANIVQGKNIFGIAGSAVQGKRWISGTSYRTDANVTTESLYSSENGAGGNLSWSVITVPTNFKVSVFIAQIMHSSGEVSRITFSMPDIAKFGRVSSGLYIVTNTNNILYTNDMGFKLPLEKYIDWPSARIEWTAYE